MSMNATHDLRRPPAAAPEFVELTDGAWLARRLGLGATGPTRAAALAALLQKEGLHAMPALPVPERLEVADLADGLRLHVAAALGCEE